MGLGLGKALKKIGKSVAKGVTASVKKLHQSAFKLTQAGFYAATGQMNKARENVRGAFLKLKEGFKEIKATSREAMQTIMQNKVLGTVFNVACAVVQPWGTAISLAAKAVAGVPLKFKDCLLSAAQAFAPQITSWVSGNLGALGEGLRIRLILEHAPDEAPIPGVGHLHRRRQHEVITRREAPRGGPGGAVVVADSRRVGGTGSPQRRRGIDHVGHAIRLVHGRRDGRPLQ